MDEQRGERRVRRTGSKSSGSCRPWLPIWTWVTAAGGGGRRLLVASSRAGQVTATSWLKLRGPTVFDGSVGLAEAGGIEGGSLGRLATGVRYRD